MTTEETGNQPVSVTIKYGAGYDEPWVIFRGSVASVASDIAEAFGLPGYTSLHEAVDLAKAVATGAAPRGFAAVLDATPVEDGPVDNTGPQQEVEPVDARSDEDQMVEAIGACETPRELKRLYLENKDYFKDAPQAVRTAFNDKNAALKGK